jgi:hypothetical protein
MHKTLEGGEKAIMWEPWGSRKNTVVNSLGILASYIQDMEAGVVSQWYSMCLACVRPWAKSPVPKIK